MKALIDFRFLFRFVLLGLIISALTVAALQGGKFLLVNNVKFAKAATSPTPLPTPQNFTCKPASQSVPVGTLVSFSTSSNNQNATWNAPGGSPSSGVGSSFQTQFNSPGNYRVWASDNSATCFIHVINPSPTPTPTPAQFIIAPKPTPQIQSPAPSINPARRQVTEFQPSEMNCPAGWVKHTSGVATVCIPEADQQTQTQDQNQIQTQTQSQSQVNNQSVNTSVTATGGNSSSSSNSSTSVNISWR